MWEHAGTLVAVPAAIEACLAIIDRFRQKRSSTHDPDSATAYLRTVQQAIGSFALDAVELAAYKRLHTVTNQFSIDLRETLVLDNPDDDFARKHHVEWRRQIHLNWQKVWEGDSAGGKLIALSADETHMTYLRVMPREIMKRTDGQPWQTYFIEKLEKAGENIENFGIFQALVRDIRGINASLNGHANRRIEKGIDELDTIMTQVRMQIREENSGV